MFASVAVLPAMRCAGSPPGILHEDQVGDEADGDEHQKRTDQPPDEEGDHQRSILTFARGSRASRSPSPNTLSDSTVSTIAMPGMIASQGAVTIRS